MQPQTYLYLHEQRCGEASKTQKRQPKQTCNLASETSDNIGGRNPVDAGGLVPPGPILKLAHAYAFFIGHLLPELSALVISARTNPGLLSVGLGGTVETVSQRLH